MKFGRRTVPADFVVDRPCSSTTIRARPDSSNRSLARRGWPMPYSSECSSAGRRLRSAVAVLDALPGADQVRPCHAVSDSPWTGPSHTVRTMKPAPFGRLLVDEARRRRRRSLSRSIRRDTPDVIDSGHVHEVAPWHRDVGGDPGALRADGILGDLDHDLLAFLEKRPESVAGQPSRCSRRRRPLASKPCPSRRRGRVRSRVSAMDVADVEERGAFKPHCRRRRPACREARAPRLPK